MPIETVPLVLYAGQIVLADWHGDALPKEPNKRRLAVVVEDNGLFVADSDDRGHLRSSRQVGFVIS